MLCASKPNAADVLLETGDGSSLAIYSRSQIGKSDLGVNRKRVTDLLDALDKRVAAAGTVPSDN